jgi:hypothetical protein
MTQVSDVAHGPLVSFIGNFFIAVEGMQNLDLRVVLAVFEKGGLLIASQLM